MFEPPYSILQDKTHWNFDSVACFFAKHGSHKGALLHKASKAHR